MPTTKAASTPEQWAEKIVGTLTSGNEPGCIPRIAKELAALKRKADCHAALVAALIAAQGNGINDDPDVWQQISDALALAEAAR